MILLLTKVTLEICSRVESIFEMSKISAQDIGDLPQ